MVSKSRQRSAGRNAGASSNGHADLRHELVGFRDTVRTDARDIAEGGVRVARTAANAATGLAKRAMKEGRNRANAASEAVEGAIQERPYTSILVAAAAGAAIAGMFMLGRRR
jgi:ElaB/YqjD/DUF883 family membrane-anchored ribosome-binding protein